VITGHDPDTGNELWRWGTWNPTRIGHWRLVPSAVAGNSVALACAPKGEPIFAVRLGHSGTLSNDALAWTTQGSRDLTSDVPTPAFAYNDFFILSDVRNSISRVDSATGEIKWTTELPRTKKWSASPTVADGKVFLLNHGGQLKVLSVEDGKILDEQDLSDENEDNIRSSVVIANGQFYIRTNTHLICAGS
jgi:outer membrane protein assembly factor BamB